MPTISMFYGIVICLYFYDDERHKLPHIHARYQGQEASFSILDGVKSSAAKSPWPRQDWCRRGLKYIERHCWPIGSWPSTVKLPLQSTRYARRDDGSCYPCCAAK